MHDITGSESAFFANLSQNKIWENAYTGMENFEIFY